MNERVTIGLPIVDELAEARLAIRSIFAQSHADWHLVLMCDGSRPETVESLRAIRDERVIVIADGQRQGLPARLNQITRMAETSLVARMDADDVMHPERLARQVAFMVTNPTVDLSGSEAWLIDTDNVVHGRYKQPSVPTVSRGWLQNGVFAHPTVMFRKNWAANYPYDASRFRTEDKELWLRAFAHSNFVKLADRLLYIRVPQLLSVKKQSITARSDRRLVREYAALLDVPSHWTLGYLLKSWSKQQIVRLAEVVGGLPIIHAYKRTAIPEDELAAATQALHLAISARVPGWD